MIDKSKHNNNNYIDTSYHKTKNYKIKWNEINIYHKILHPKKEFRANNKR